MTMTLDKTPATLPTETEQHSTLLDRMAPVITLIENVTGVDVVQSWPDWKLYITDESEAIFLNVWNRSYTDLGRAALYFLLAWVAILVMTAVSGFLMGLVKLASGVCVAIAAAKLLVTVGRRGYALIRPAIAEPVVLDLDQPVENSDN